METAAVILRRDNGHIIYLDIRLACDFYNEACGLTGTSL